MENLFPKSIKLSSSSPPAQRTLSLKLSLLSIVRKGDVSLLPLKQETLNQLYAITLSLELDSVESFLTAIASGDVKLTGIIFLTPRLLTLCSSL